MPTTPTHITTALRAVLDHIDTHQLPIPAEIQTPGHGYPDTPDALVLQIPWGREEFARWEETLNSEYSYTARRIASEIADTDDFERAEITTTLGPLGIRVVIVGRWRVPAAAHLAAVEG